MDVSGRAHRGLLSGADMAAWSASVEEPIGYDYGRYRVLKPGPWSQGLAALQQLAPLKGFAFDALDPARTRFHSLAGRGGEARPSPTATPSTAIRTFAAVPTEILLSDAYNDKRRAMIGPTASLDQRPGVIQGYGKALARAQRGLVARPLDRAARANPLWVGSANSRGDTVHFDIVDRHGNMIAATPSGGWLQSSPTIPTLGFCLGTRAQMFVLDEAHPASLAPGKRPRSTLSPTMALRDGEPYLAWGTPGGDQQDQWIPQFFLRHVHAGLNFQESIDAPAWHTEHSPPRSGRAPRARASWSWKAACRNQPSRNCVAAATSSKSGPRGQRAGSSPRPAIGTD